jgi:hypothetical protein
MEASKVRKLVGKQVVASHRHAGIISGKLVKVSGTHMYVQTSHRNGKKVKTSAILPLALFDLLAIGTAPYAFGGFYGGYPYGGFYGYPGYFW